MRVVVADTGPIHYLILIGHISLLPQLFERVVLPSVVLSELSHELARHPLDAGQAPSPPGLKSQSRLRPRFLREFTRAKLRLSHWHPDSTPTWY